MPYPTYVKASLIEIDGNSCGTLEHRLEWKVGATPPEYTEIDGGGDFFSCRCYQATENNETTWRLDLVYRELATCRGSHAFIRGTAADDPTGDYCIDDGGPDCSKGKAGVVDDDY